MTNQHDLQAYLEFARQLAAECSQLAVHQYGGSAPRRKYDGTLVTKTDEQIDRLITSRIGAAYPAHAVLSEEQSTIYDPSIEYTWVADPLDGTTNFARGLPIWGVSIALLQHGQPIVGVIDFPLVREQFYALRGGGACKSGDVQITATAAEDVEGEQILMKCTRTDRIFHVDTPLKTRVMGSAAYHLCKVADGTALACIEGTPKVWDVAAAHLILLEAGALITTNTGERLFPLAAERRDYRALSIITFAAANAAIMQHLNGHVTLRQ